MAETDAVPGFISVVSRSMDGRSSLAVSHIAAVGPTKRNREGDPECTIVMDGDDVVVSMRRQDVLQLIAESIGAIPVGTGAQLDATIARVQGSTRRLRAVAESLQAVRDDVGRIQAAQQQRIAGLAGRVKDNTRRVAAVLDSTPKG